MFMELKMMRTETSLSGADIRESTNNGKSFMKMNGQRSQRKEN